MTTGKKKDGESLKWPRNLLKKQSERSNNKKYRKTAKPQSERVGEKNKKIIVKHTTKKFKMSDFCFLFLSVGNGEKN